MKSRVAGIIVLVFCAPAFAQQKVTPYASKEICVAANHADNPTDDYGCVKVNGGWEWKRKIGTFIGSTTSTAKLVADRAAGLTIVVGSGKYMVTIHPNGKVEFGNGYTPNKAAKTFWESIGGYLIPDTEEKCKADGWTWVAKSGCLIPPKKP